MVKEKEKPLTRIIRIDRVQEKSITPIHFFLFFVIFFHAEYEHGYSLCSARLLLLVFEIGTRS